MIIPIVGWLLDDGAAIVQRPGSDAHVMVQSRTSKG
jgi:hypothetical protein